MSHIQQAVAHSLIVFACFVLKAPRGHGLGDGRGSKAQTIPMSDNPGIPKGVESDKTIGVGVSSCTALKGLTHSSKG